MIDPGDTRRAGRRLRLLIVMGAAALAGSCGDRDVAGPVPVPEPGGELFLRYVSLGNSITAGFQSGGIHAGLQNEAYPVLLARKAGATFGVPELSYPGCPPPLAGPLTAERIAETLCSFRDPDRPALVQNLAVPGHRLGDALVAAPPGTVTLAPLILGGLTQVEAMRQAEPTLVSLWLGNNDALAAALSGDTTRLTPLADFQAALDRVVEAIAATPAADAILIGVIDPVRIAPALQPGAYFWLLAQAGDAPVPLAVADDCAPGTPGGSRQVSFLVAAAHVEGRADSVRVRCDPEAAFVLNEAEAAAVATRIGAFNGAIRAAAESQGWIYVDATTALVEPALAEPDLVRKCQGLATATTPAALRAAVERTCPHPTAPAFFGAYVSFDGIHPSSAAHAVIADTLAGRVNAKHGLALPVGS